MLYNSKINNITLNPNTFYQVKLENDGINRVRLIIKDRSRKV